MSWRSIHRIVPFSKANSHYTESSSFALLLQSAPGSTLVSLIPVEGLLSLRVYNDSCNPMFMVFADNPCTAGAFGRSPASIKFDALHLNGLDYACRIDPNSGTSEGYGIQVCCRNDGD
ncbi:hypothetical protein EV421DRAFT_1896301 [Armillaria borealis]|uniref:Uncharacterized protein n=1 Tax=Armillaria borealis TaxID=47425 RepID=A0AA39K6T1_9AGAR|nr:hypothetical protein EV421DRAFT_1896301 [Armillaria borealis]